MENRNVASFEKRLYIGSRLRRRTQCHRGGRDIGGAGLKSVRSSAVGNCFSALSVGGLLPTVVGNSYSSARRGRGIRAEVGAVRDTRRSNEGLFSSAKIK